MPNKKKDLPLVVLKAIEPYLKKHDTKYEIIDPKDSILKIIDSDPTSDFFIEILKSEISGGKTVLNIAFKPKNRSNTNFHTLPIEYTSFDKYFQSWVAMLDEYEKVDSIYDDPIVKQNAEKFFQKFDILDEDADYTTFDLEQQLFLEEYLINTKEKLKSLKDGQSKDKVAELDELEKDADEIRNVLTKDSKRKIIRRLSIFFGKAQKSGLEVIKEIFINVSAEIVKKLLLGQ
jgi:hypothetical protein